MEHCSYVYEQNNIVNSICADDFNVVKSFTKMALAGAC